jgi:DeoR/GlpR family transcriptional regulator of sugar metabolism
VSCTYEVRRTWATSPGAGQISAYLAEELVSQEDITVITNSLQVFDILRGNYRINLISTGGLLRSANETLVGLTGVGALKELRADKLFVEVDGVTLDFGLSDTNMAEVTMKQAMLRAARNVILLADHTKFGQESAVQLAPANVVNMLITDNALAASDRLEFATLGVEVMVAKI